MKAREVKEQRIKKQPKKQAKGERFILSPAHSLAFMAHPSLTKHRGRERERERERKAFRLGQVAAHHSSTQYNGHALPRHLLV